ncbi:MAG TPA: hypothetical protein VJC21_00125, partial [Candidatus Nanoarchaeia archaeon]|nr:hypothetical protein [Candidatus Nanoarchaeia archaeon]
MDEKRAEAVYKHMGLFFVIGGKSEFPHIQSTKNSAIGRKMVEEPKPMAVPRTSAKKANRKKSAATIRVLCAFQGS